MSITNAGGVLGREESLVSQVGSIGSNKSDNKEFNFDSFESIESTGTAEEYYIFVCLFLLDVLLLEKLTKSFKSNKMVRFSIETWILQHILLCSKFSGNSFHSCSWFISSTFNFLGFVRCIAKALKSNLKIKCNKQV